MNCSVSQLSGTSGSPNCGSPPEIEARSPTLGTGSPKPMTTAAVIAMPASGAGIAIVSLGSAQITAIVSATSASTNASCAGSIHDPSAVLKKSIWLLAMTMASPLTKPSITGCGTSRMNLPQRMMPTKIWIAPIRITVRNRYCTPTPGGCAATSETMTTASAPVAPEIIPGRPPISAVMSPTMNAA